MNPRVCEVCKYSYFPSDQATIGNCLLNPPVPIPWQTYPMPNGPAEMKIIEVLWQQPEITRVHVCYQWKLA